MKRVTMYQANNGMTFADKKSAELSNLLEELGAGKTEELTAIAERGLKAARALRLIEKGVQA